MEVTCALMAEIDVFPNAISLLPVPVTLYPITIWLVPLLALGSAPLPIITLFEPLVITSPAFSPTAVLSDALLFDFALRSRI